MPLEVVRSLAPDAWDDYAERNASVNIFHTRQFADCFAGSSRYVPHTFFLQEDGRTVAAMVSLQTKILPRFPSLASRAVVFGGISIADEATPRFVNKNIGSLLEAYDNSIRNQTLFTEIRNMDDQTRRILAVTRSGYKFAPHLNFLVDLSAGTEVIWDGFSSDQRRSIKRPEKAGVIVREMSEPQLDVFHALVTRIYERAHVPFFPVSTFEAAWRRLSPLRQLRITFAEHDGKVVAARAALLYHGRVFDWFAGSSEEGEKLNANALLVWEMMKWGSENGYVLFDFGGAGDPNTEYNVREFKSRFQGETVNYGRFVRVYSRPRYQLGYRAYGVLRRILF
jgi:lipid II:glycine glycyltransferase (peptidoglycan interpeptide bridge formation enzyme)